MDNELCHYGVKGQKWGVRRTKAQLGYKTGSSKKKKSSTASDAAAALGRSAKKAASAVSNVAKNRGAKRAAKKEAKAEVEKMKSIKKKKISELTDEELNAKIKRLELEKKYKELATPTKVDKGKSFTLKVLERIGENTMTNVGSQAATHILGTAVNKAYGVDYKAFGKDRMDEYREQRIVNPQKGQSDKK